MKLTINNYRGIESAEIEMDKITLVAGPNAAGKTSVAQALTSLVTGNVLPLPELIKSDAGMLIRTGAAPSEISLMDEEGESVITYPKAELSTKGEPMSASEVACGVQSVATMPAKARSEYLADLLGTAPTKEALLAALAAIDAKPEHGEKLWETIEIEGWDGAWAKTKEKGAGQKGAWQEVTGGENYGKTKAESWLPEGWTTDLDGASEESLTAKVVETREYAEAAVAVVAVDADLRERLEKEAKEVATLQKREAEAGKAVLEVQKKIDEAVGKQAGLPKPQSDEKTTPCPECDAPVVIQGDILVKPAVPNEKENAKREKALVAAAEVIKNNQKAYDDLMVTLNGFRHRLADAINATSELNDLPAGDAKAQSTESIEATRSAVDAAERALDAFTRKTRAHALHGSIVLNTAVVALLAPGGLRKDALESALGAFNKGLVAYSEDATWPTVHMADDLSITYDGRPLMLCSMSEQYRARVILQLACAEIDGSDVVVIDGADILDKGGRNGLFRVLSCEEYTVLVCMTIPDKEDMPDLQAWSYGNSYWLERSG